MVNTTPERHFLLENLTCWLSQLLGKNFKIIYGILFCNVVHIFFHSQNMHVSKNWKFHKTKNVGFVQLGSVVDPKLFIPDPDPGKSSGSNLY